MNSPDEIIMSHALCYITGNGVANGNDVANGNGVVHQNGKIDDEPQPLPPPPQKEEEDEKEKKKMETDGVLELFSFADKWDVFWICLGGFHQMGPYSQSMIFGYFQKIFSR